MKTITIPEFEILVASDNWDHDQAIEVNDRFVNNNCEEALNNIAIPTLCCGTAVKTSTLDEITITYVESFDYHEYQADTFSAGTEGLDNVWTIEGIIIVDEEGLEVDDWELVEYLGDEFSAIDYSSLELELCEVIDIDIDIDTDGDRDMETFIIEIDNAPNIRFSGEEIASVESSGNSAISTYFSGQEGRWTELVLYKTKGGKFICHQIGHTNWAGERTRYSGKVCETIEEVKEFFGHRWLAKDLYYEAKIEHITDVE